MKNRNKGKEQRVGEIKPQNQYAVHSALLKETELAACAVVETKNSSSQYCS